MANKKNYTYSLAQDVAKQLDQISQRFHRSKSSIVQEAVRKWIRDNKDL